MKKYSQLSAVEANELYKSLKKEYAEFCQRGLSLDISRGKPNSDQLDIVDGLLDMPFTREDLISNGVDCRNYGMLDGTAEAKELFGELLNLDPNSIIVGGNSSLQLMYDALCRAMIFGTCDSDRPWCKEEGLKWICITPGYDRHFKITEELGFELVSVKMTENGPDMDVVEELAANDEAVKGIWCVPLYSNPQGVCYSDETVARLGKMKTAAIDFKIFWDNAYGVHHIYEEVKLADIFAACEAGGNPDRAYYFFSTSKITFPGAGVAMMAASFAERKEILKRMGIQTIGSDKLNQLRTLRTLKDAPTLKKHMAELADILRPKFDIVKNTLERELGEADIANWTNPNGGYFVSLNTLDGCAKRTYKLLKKAGVTVTTVGATYPYGNDLRDRNIRIAPTYPSNEELQDAMNVLCLCVKIASVEKMLDII